MTTKTAKTATTSAAKTVRMSYLDFTLKAIDSRPNKDYKGLHTVYSGFNSAFKAYFGADSNPIEAVDKLVKECKIAKRFARGGAIIYRTKDAPAAKQDNGGNLLKAMGINS